MKGNRTKLEALYFAYANGEGGNNLEPHGHTAQNQQKYLKL